MKRAVKKERAQLRSLLEQRAETTDIRQRASVEKDLSNLVLRPLKLYAEGDTTAKVAELAQGLADLARRGSYFPEMTATEAVQRAAQERGVDISDVPANVSERLAKLV